MKKKKTEKKLIVLSVVVTILCLGFIFMEISTCRKKITEHHGNHLLQQLQLLEEAAKQRTVAEDKVYSEMLLQVIEEKIETDSRHFCVVGKDGTLLLVRDKRMTLEYSDKSASEFLGNPAVSTGAGVTEGRFSDGETYVYAVKTTETAEGTITVAVCTQKKYIWEQVDFDILNQRMIVYLGLTALAYVASVTWLAMSCGKLKQQKEEQNEQLMKNRVLIDKLVNKLDARMSGALVDEDGGLYSREIVEQVMGTMTPEQKKRSYCLMIEMQENSPDLLVRLSVVLDRLLTGGSICCLWEENQFRAVLMNVEEEVAITLSKQLIMQYQRMFQQDLNGVSVKVLNF